MSKTRLKPPSQSNILLSMVCFRSKLLHCSTTTKNTIFLLTSSRLRPYVQCNVCSVCPSSQLQALRNADPIRQVQIVVGRVRPHVIRVHPVFVSPDREICLGGMLTLENLTRGVGKNTVNKHHRNNTWLLCSRYTGCPTILF